jgi:hypothetical protein
LVISDLGNVISRTPVVSKADALAALDLIRDEAGGAQLPGDSPKPMGRTARGDAIDVFSQLVVTQRESPTAVLG